MNLLLALLLPANAADFLQPDAGAPGMAVQLNILSDLGGFTGAELITTSCPDIVPGPVAVLDRGADPASPLTGAVLSTVFFIDAAASTADCTIYIDGAAISGLSSAVDNAFSIVAPLPAPVDGGTGDADGTADGVITIAATDRSDGGVAVFESLSVPSGTTLFFDVTDPDGATDGNEAYLPAVLLVAGSVALDGVIDIAGWPGEFAASGEASDGGSGGVGGGGGGVGSNCLGPVFAAGDGFTGGGGTASGTCIDFGDGGTGAIEGPDAEHGGEGVFTITDNGAIGYAGGTGGGSGVPWGTGGGGGECCGSAGEGGYGGGGGNGHSDASGWGGGGGGFGTSGENGTGTVGGGTTSYLVGGAGLASGHETLVPLGGGSGGAGGDSGDNAGDGAGGGGGGGALMIRAESIAFGDEAVILAAGGDGGETTGENPGSSSGGAGGSGGGVLLAAGAITGLDVGSLEFAGGYGGSEAAGYVSGSGGEGRLRVDGAAPPSLAAGPTGFVPSTFEGPAIAAIVDGEITVSSSGSVTLIVQDIDGAEIAEVAVAEDGTEVFYDALPGAGTYLLTLVDDATGVLGPAGSATWAFEPDADEDGFDDPTYGGDDCDDTDSSINPDADELCDDIDNDCDDTIDEDAADALIWYDDLDGDGFGNPETEASGCVQPADTSDNSEDCDDTEGSINPDADEVCDAVDNDCDGLVDEDDAIDAWTWYADTDSDGFGDSAATTTACEEPDGYTDNDLDCDDSEGAINPDADEVCDEADNDCDARVDEDATDAVSWYADSDEDGFGDADGALASCEQPDDYVSNSLDCDDGDADISPNGVEICNDTDDDCDDTIDEDATDALIWYADSDDDGYGDGLFTLESCTQPDGYADNDADCDDDASGVNPDAEEVCNAIDDDCDEGVDEEALDALDWYLDFDEDGFGDASVVLTACEAPSGYVDNDEDCDDGFTTVYPDAEEICDGLDNDCDEFVDEEATDDAIWYADADEDGFGDPGDAIESCEQPDGYIDNDFDCDDDPVTGPDISPAADEYCDGIDNDCDDIVDNDDALDARVWYLDADDDDYGAPDETVTACEEPDGYSDDDRDCDDDDDAVNPGAAELWYDGIDQNCDELNDYDQDYDGYVADGYGPEAGGSAPLANDCEDTDATINPGADDDWYDGIDSNCDGASDYDADGDGFESASYGGDDCDDSDAETYPGAPDEPGDGVITDCDETDEYDADGDGFDGEAFGGDDCDDANGDINPDTPEVYYDGLDNDCDDATIDDDQDGDGVTVDEDCDDLDPDLYPGAPGYDEDCEPLDTGDTGADTGDDTGPGDDTAPTGDDTGPAGDDTATGADDTAVVSGDDTGGDTDSDSDIDGDGVDDDKGGCGCGGKGGDTAWYLLLPGLIWVRRRKGAARGEG